MLAYTESYRILVEDVPCVKAAQHDDTMGASTRTSGQQLHICQSQWGKSAVVYRHGIGPSLDGVDDPVVPRDECQRRRISPLLAPLEPTVDRASLIGWLNLAKSKKRGRRKSVQKKRLVTFGTEPRPTKPEKLTRAPGSGMIGGRRPVNAPRMTPAGSRLT